MKRKQTLLFLGGLIIIIFAFLSFTSRARGARLSIQNTPSSGTEAQIQELESALQTVQDADMQKSLQDKLEAQQFALNVQAEAQTEPTLSLDAICANRVPLPKSATDMEQGILSVREDFLASKGLKINNMFRGVLNGYVVEVYAGSLNDQLSQGLVILSIEDLGIWLQVTDSTAEGSLEIMAADNLRLSLRSALGNQLYFDIAGQQFVDSLDTVLPVVPLPAAKDVFIDPCTGK